MENYFKTVSYNYESFNKNSATLLLIVGKYKPLPYKLENSTLTIGRNVPGSTVDLKISSDIVSANHGVFSNIDGKWYYTCKSQTNGTFYNGEKLQHINNNSSKPICLNDGDILRIDSQNLNNPHSQAVTIIFSKTYNITDKWYSKEIHNNEIITIGRQEGQIQIDKSYISKEHAKIFSKNDVLYLQNCNSLNGVLLNNVSVKDTTRLYDRNVIKICDIFIFVLDGYIFYNSSLTEKQGVFINIEKVAVIKNMRKTNILKNVKLSINKGDFVLILGGSGAGKTTLVNAILGKIKISGNIKFKDSTNHRIGFVPQTLTVRKEEKVKHLLRDTIICRTKLRDKTKINKRIEETLDILGLSSKINDKIYSLSGGEKRRVSIANEIVTDPDLFFLDEPDSGLDPKSGIELMNTLKHIADDGTDNKKIVLLISHAYQSYLNPELIFSKVIVLAKSDRSKVGELAFYGSVEEALAFFDVDNLGEIITKINPKSEFGKGQAEYYVKKFNKER